jgi:hypothetical protein
MRRALRTTLILGHACSIGDLGHAQAEGHAPVVQGLAEGQRLADGDPFGIGRPE